MATKEYTDYAYVSRNELRKLLHLNEHGLGELLCSNRILGVMIGKRLKYCLRHVRQAQDAMLDEQRRRIESIEERAMNANRKADAQ